jgi:hypothetical protein
MIRGPNVRFTQACPTKKILTFGKRSLNCIALVDTNIYSWIGNTRLLEINYSYFIYFFGKYFYQNRDFGL